MALVLFHRKSSPPFSTHVDARALRSSPLSFPDQTHQRRGNSFVGRFYSIGRPMLGGLLAVLLMAAQPASPADFKVVRTVSSAPYWESYVIEVSGPIVRGDHAKFSRAVSDVETGLRNSFYSIERTEVTLASNGGDVDEALAIGRDIRRFSMFTRIYDVCASSCVLIFAAGVERTSVGFLNRSNGLFTPRLGVHRPYFVNLEPNQPRSTIAPEIDRRRRALGEYMEEMGVAPQLVSIMYSLQPEEMRWLTVPEASEFGLLGKDAAWDEAQVANSAATFGLTSAGYRRKRVSLERICSERHAKNQTHDIASCVQAELRGIDQASYAERQLKLRQYLASQAESGRVIKSGKPAQACAQRFLALGLSDC